MNKNLNERVAFWKGEKPNCLFSFQITKNPATSYNNKVTNQSNQPPTDVMKQTLIRVAIFPFPNK